MRLKISEALKITFTQTGGYVGLVKGCTLDTRSLPADEAAELKTLIERSDIFRTSSQLTPNARDLQVYEITVETAQGAHRVELDDMSVPQSMRPLLNYLVRNSKPMRLE